MKINNFFMLMMLAPAPITFIGCPSNNKVNNGSGISGAARPAASKPTGAISGDGTAFTIVRVTPTSTNSGNTQTGDSTGSPQTGTTSGATSTVNFTLIFNANNLDRNLTDVCSKQDPSGNSGDTSRACKCHFVWEETNLSISSRIQRTVNTDLTDISNFQVTCPAPSVFTTEIPDQTKIKISIIPVLPQNVSGFNTNEAIFTKTVNNDIADFRDIEGRGFKNIIHYSCFDRFQKALSIAHALKTPTTPSDQNPVPVALANSFQSGTNAVSSFSAQSYYFDFYVRSNEQGSINAGNASFTCPRVMINGQSKFFPEDSTFALALNFSKDFPLQVNSKIIVAANSGSDTGTVLGFAAKAAPDGTCPAFTDSLGKLRNTFRLRQYSAVYPIRYAADGSILGASQPINTVYVLDRPVNKATVGLSSKPITRLGPKPCPFSFKTAQFGQKCSTDAALSGNNIDGTQIQGNPECPIYPSPKKELLKPDGTLVIRPFKPFLAEYIENTNFKACAFSSSNAVDPEIVVMHDDGAFPSPAGPTDFYCAKHYPNPANIIPSSSGDPMDKPPGECDLAAAAQAIKGRKSYACSKTFDPFNGASLTPTAGCCQICSGTNCISKGGGITARGRNGAFSPPRDTGNPAVSSKTLPRATPNSTLGSGCFDPWED